MDSPNSNHEILRDNDYLANGDTGINGVAEDIHYLIISELAKVSTSAVFALAQSSRALRRSALPFAYRHLTLRKGSNMSKIQQAYQLLVEEFRNDTDSLVAKHVRELTIKEGLPADDLKLIFNQISQHGTLRKLNWETSAHMPKEVLEKIQLVWPDLELSVRVLNRQNASTVPHRQMDINLLASPLLVKLVYTIYNQGYSAEQPSRSEWPKLTQALVSGGSVKYLHIECQTDGNAYIGMKILDDREPLTFARLDITPETRLPQLLELKLNIQRYWGQSNYLWDAEHCSLLRNAMDWSLLRKLDFGTDNPTGFFSAFTGWMPNLKALRFGVTEGLMGPAQNFIHSLESLESLDIARAQISINTLWPAIMRHKDTLKELILRPATSDYCYPQYIDIRILKTVTKDFPSLERLGWDAPVQSNIDRKHSALLCTLNLKKLDLFLHLPQSASEYSDELRQNAGGTIAPPPLNRGNTEKAALSLMEKISQAQEEPLEWLTLHLARTGFQDRAQPYLMQAKLQLRRSKDVKSDSDPKYEYRGNAQWNGLSSIEDVLALEAE
ncbi:hypothetical protein BKA66DRAFT_546225 [Pyrenochaeta sp. MPI-SDFR-AT-0127]|nr:hypothetical protein BKA66DRAFT_546225 [Pyrenochaeta sp. MPI-SDFR-AT-0127]